MAERSDGTWAARIVVIIVPRQNGKGSILEVVELTHLFVIETTRLIIHSAHEFATSQEHFERMYALIDEAPDFKRMIAPRGIHRSHGSEGFTLRDGSRMKFKTRSKGGGRGFSGDLVVLDEAYDLPPKAVSALQPTMSARPNPQVILTSSAPLDDDGSAVLRGLARAGRLGAEDMAFLEWCCEVGVDLDDPAAHQRANPAYPFRIGPRDIAAERTMMAQDPEGFARERLGIWNDDDADTGWQAIKRARWIACEDKGSTIDETRGVAIALDVSPDRDRASFVGAGWSRNGGVHLEVIDQLTGTDGVVARAAKFSEEIAIAKGSPAWSLEPDLTKAGVKVRPIGTEEHSQACGDLLDAIDQQQIRHLGSGVAGQPLTDAARNAVFKTYGDASLWARRKSSGDITALVAGTLARWCLIHVETIDVAANVW